MVAARVLAIGSALLVMSVASATARAQPPSPPDLAAGYLNVLGTMHGVNAQLTAPLRASTGLVLEMNRSHGKEPDTGPNDPVYDDLSFLIGARVGLWSGMRTTPFVQALFGSLHSRRTNADESSYSFFGGVIQAGFGVTTMINKRTGIRAQLDAQFGDPEKIGMLPRLVADVVIRLR